MEEAATEQFDINFAAPEIFHDRMNIEDLRNGHVDILNALRNRNAGKIGSKEKVQFCGLVFTASRKPVVFLPIKFPNSDPRFSASLLMEVLERYEQESGRSADTNAAGAGTAGLIATIADLVEDFVSYGIYRESRRVNTRGNGKPDWPRTVVRRSPLFTANNAPVYIDIDASKRIDHFGSMVSRVQTAALIEISELFGWWRKDLENYSSMLKRLPVPHEKRSEWKAMLLRAKRDLYQDRAIRLVEKLIDYIENTKDIRTGVSLYGVDDFHTVWEQMLRDTLVGVESHWNARLPKPSLIAKNGKEIPLTKSGMKTDIIARIDKKIFVLDAKYYAADAPDSFPGWGDIAKQLIYEIAIKDVVGETFEVRNAFVFPVESENLEAYSSIELRMKIYPLPKINLVYLSIEDIMGRYAKGLKRVVLEKFSIY